MSRLYKALLAVIVLAGTVFLSSQEIEIVPNQPAVDLSAYAQLAGATFTGNVNFNAGLTLPAYTNLGTHDLNLGSGFDTTSDTYSALIAYTNSSGIDQTVIAALSNQQITITDNKVTANSKIHVFIMSGQTDLASGLTIVTQTTPLNGSFVFILTNLSAAAFTAVLNVAWYIEN
jgi:hypothetical protein